MTPADLGSRPRNSGRRTYTGAAPWLLLLPAFVLLGLLVFLPYLLTFYYSTTNATLGNLTRINEIGLKNFQTIANTNTPPFGQVLLVTAVFTTGTVIGALTVGTALALSLYSLASGRRSILLALYLVPWVIAGVVIGYTWKLVYDSQVGLANTLLATFGLQPVGWLLDQWTAVGSLVVASIWASYGVVLLIVSGALANLPPNLILAGQADGASYWTIIRRIILPGIRPAFLLAALVAVVSGLNVFDSIYVMTGGGPVYQTETAALEMFRLTFKRGSVGEGGAITVVLFAVSLFLAVLYVGGWRRETSKWH